MHRLRYTQKLPLSLEECWNFFSCPKNLKIITPEYLGFEILNDQDIAIYPGRIIHYKIKPIFNIPTEWVTEITHIQKPEYFIDEQRSGPYKLWHHEHRFESIPNGILMHDLIYYELFFGSLGRALNSLWVKKAVEAIFEYRRDKLETLFGLYPEAGRK